MSSLRVYHYDNLFCEISWDKPNPIAHVHNYTKERSPFMPYITKNEEFYDIPFENVIKFLETRCVPKTREDVDNLVRKKYHIPEWNPYWICKKTHGVSNTDYYWVQFDDEDIKYADVRVR